MLVNTRQQTVNQAGFWKRLLALTVLVAYVYVFFEWIFYATMPSFMSLMSLIEKVEIFLLAGFVLALAGTAVIVLLMIVDTIVLRGHFWQVTHSIGVMIPSLILAGMVLLLVDNFTYTVFKFGIGTTTGIWRGAYGLLFVGLLVYIYFQMLFQLGWRAKAVTEKKPRSGWLYVPVGLLVISAFLAGVKLEAVQVRSPETARGGQAARHPNILLLGSDGLNADFLSVYGYDKDTTPTLRALAKTSLVVENAFTNAGNTAGSVISIMTSKLPTQTRVLYPPDILMGINAYQHLPGLLKNEGYKSIEYGTPYYVDAYSFNVQSGFEMVNNRSKTGSKLALMGQKLGDENPAYFMSKLIERISDRVLHIFYIRVMENPFSVVTKPVPSMKDEEKVRQILTVLDQAKTPVFIHAHLLGTHGGYFSPKVRVFSKDERQSQPWMPDFYADTILAFDSYVAQVIDHLKETGQYDNTILIIYTDHDEQFHVNQRIPLIIHFPHDQWAGQLTRPAENIDIAPTILDYLELPQPDWMQGVSLLRGTKDEPRLIFSMGTNKYKQNENDIYFLDPSRDKPPFYQFSYVNIVDCQKWYSFDLTTYTWKQGEVPNYVAPCENLRSFDEIKQALKYRLASDGFDISSLP